MAVVQKSSDTQAQLVYLIEDDDNPGKQKKQTKTFSNLIANPTDDQIYNGMTAVAGICEPTEPTIQRIETSELVEE